MKLNLRELRESKELRQEDVAKKLDVNQGTISNWERGVARPFLKYRKKLAKLYGVTVDELLKPEDQDAS